MAANRWKLIQLLAGGAVLVLMLVLAAFALGVYVGEHGWTREGLAYGPGAAAKGPAAQAKPPQAAPDGNGTPQVPFLPAGLPPGPPQLTGRIRQVAQDHLELAAAGGPRTVLLTDATQFRDETGQPITLRDLEKGDVVAVFGAFTQGDGGQLLAEFVVGLPVKE
jgi:hypothetical protein